MSSRHLHAHTLLGITWTQASLSQLEGTRVLFGGVYMYSKHVTSLSCTDKPFMAHRVVGPEV